MSDILLLIGKKIKSNRVKKKISTNFVSLDLRLSSKYLQKIETGILDEELETNNVIRYLKLYLDYFNMDSNTIINDYRHKLSITHKTKKKNNVIRNILILSNKNYIRISIIILFLLFTYFFYLENNQKEKLISSLLENSKILLRN